MTPKKRVITTPQSNKNYMTFIDSNNAPKEGRICEYYLLRNMRNFGTTRVRRSVQKESESKVIILFLVFLFFLIFLLKPPRFMTPKRRVITTLRSKKNYVNFIISNDAPKEGRICECYLLRNMRKTRTTRVRRSVQKERFF